MKKLPVIHPFLFAIFPILFLFAYNIDEVQAGDLLLPILVIIVGTLALFFLSRLITKSYDKSGIITFFFLVLFFSYGHVRYLVLSLVGPGIYSSNYLWGPLWALLFIVGAFFVTKSRSSFVNFTKFLNIAAVTLIVISVVKISIYQITTINRVPEEVSEEGDSLNLDTSDNLPDIYYIILDGYARASTLEEIYNYDNSEFTDYLTDKGFYIAAKSRSNYAGTRLSLASSLNVEYINYLFVDKVGTTQKDITFPYEMIENNEVSRLLKSKGYRYIYVSSGYGTESMSRYAEVYKPQETVFGISMSNLSRYLIQTSALQPLVSLLGTDVRNSILYVFDTLAGMPNMKESTFVLAHIMAPHPPFVFDRDGNATTPNVFAMKGFAWNDKEGYIDQLIFVNTKVETLVDEVLSKSDVAPIIILQADHGPGSAGQGELPYSELTKTQVDEKMNIFNAYYFPEKGRDLLYESITPVNSFRVVFNLYFDASYDLLKDESYFSNFRYLYEFHLVPPEDNNYD